MLDRAILARGIHGLKNRQHGPAILGVKPFLQGGQPGDTVGQQLLCRCLGYAIGAEIAGIEFLQRKFLAVGDTIAFEQTFRFLPLHPLVRFTASGPLA